MMPQLDQFHRDNGFDRFQVCVAYHALEYDWNRDGWVHERPSNRRRRESIGVQLHRMGFKPGFDVHALIAWGLAPEVDPDDDLGEYIRSTYIPEFVAEHFPQLMEPR
jgi:hypothetical protein